MRAFLGFPLPPPLQERVGELQRSLDARLPGIRWVRRASVHHTVLFLGEIDPAESSPLTAVLVRRCAGIPPGRLHLRGLGVLPLRGRPRVLHMGLEEDAAGSLLRLRRAAVEAAEARGIPVEKRPFRAHVTLGRYRGRLTRKTVTCAVEELGDVDLGTFPLERCILYESILGPGGPRYEEKGCVELQAGA